MKPGLARRVAADSALVGCGLALTYAFLTIGFFGWYGWEANPVVLALELAFFLTVTGFGVYMFFQDVAEKSGNPGDHQDAAHDGPTVGGTGEEAMMDDVAGALAVLKRAMQIEREGREFYLEAARTNEDGSGRATFAALANDEQKHFHLVQRQYDVLVRDNKWVRPESIAPVRIDPGRPLFSEIGLARGKTPAGSSAMDALLLGLDIESRACELYRVASLGNMAPLVFEFLTREERGHFDILLVRYEHLMGLGTGRTA